MCASGGGAPAPVTPAPAPAPAAPAPDETAVGQARKNENVSEYGTIRGPNLRVDRSTSGGVAGGSGLTL